MLLNGAKPSRKLFEKSTYNSQLLVGVDGGTNWLVRNNFKVDLILGDLDSVTNETLKKSKNFQIIKLKNQNLTDFDKSVRFLINKYEVGEIEVWGATGKRIDHFLANLSILKKLTKKVKITFCDDYSESILIFEDSILKGKIGQQISLIPICNAKEVTLKGFKFETTKMDLVFGQRVSSSNQFAKTKAKVSLKKGCLFVSKIRLGKE